MQPLLRFAHKFPEVVIQRELGAGADVKSMKGHGGMAPEWRLACSSDYESMGAREASVAKIEAHPDWIALRPKVSQEQRDGTNPFVPGSIHDEIWRDA